MNSETEALIRECELERVRTEVAIAMAHIALERSEIVMAPIRERLEEPDEELEEAKAVLRSAGLLRD